MRKHSNVFLHLGADRHTLAGAQTFTDVNTPQYWGKTGIPALTAAVDANNAMIEGGTVDASFDEVTVNNTLTAISLDNDGNHDTRSSRRTESLTGRLSRTIRSTMTRWTSRTSPAADLTLTDAGAITSSGLITGDRT
jgi:hypothetical protein